MLFVQNNESHPHVIEDGLLSYEAKMSQRLLHKCLFLWAVARILIASGCLPTFVFDGLQPTPLFGAADLTEPVGGSASGSESKSNQIILKCFSAASIAASFSGGHCGCLASSDLGLL